MPGLIKFVVIIGMLMIPMGAIAHDMDDKENARINFEKTISMDLVEREDESRQEEAKECLSKL